MTNIKNKTNIEKTCFKCGVSKPISSFYKHIGMADGYVNKCKDCNKRDVRANYADKVDQYREYDRIRNMIRVDYISYKNKQWTNKNNERSREMKKDWCIKNKAKRSAHIAVGNAVRTGKICAKPCIICQELKVEAHHCDYSRVFDVVWLCNKHHNMVHRLYNQMDNFKSLFMSDYTKQKLKKYYK